MIYIAMTRLTVRRLAATWPFQTGSLGLNRTREAAFY
jgi:hypothetical protein